MKWLVENLWLIPALPLLAAGLSALVKRPSRRYAAGLAIGSMTLAFLLSVAAFSTTLSLHGDEAQQYYNFDWFVLGETTFRLGWLLDPITAAMLVMITFVGTLIFIFSVGYMAHDRNFTRFFCFLALFAAAMLGLVIANNLLLLFMCWEVVGLASYLLIGFWYEKPSAAAAAKKAFITTRIGDVFFFLGILWLSAETGTLLFYDKGAGCLEQSAVATLIGQSTMIGMGLSTAISLLIFCGAVGKSGQVPLHVWLPDAMEGPTPVSALIHAATMVAAGVFLVARMYPLMEAVPQKAVIPEVVQSGQRTSASPGVAGEGAEVRGGASAVGGKAGAAESAKPPSPSSVSFALKTVTWIGAITALFAALIAVAQTDIKRILAYSTVSQLGFMFMGLGAGGVAVGMFHLLTHAFFKALLFLGSGSVIHGCHEEQDIRRMGGLRKLMPVTFATYAIGMMALSGVPLLFSGFWSKDEILHAASVWAPSKWPFFLGVVAAFLTAFYMTRQMWYVFFAARQDSLAPAAAEIAGHRSSGHEAHEAHAEHIREPHESPPVMTMPLVILAASVVLLSVFATPVWPWFHSYLSGHGGHPEVSLTVNVGTLLILFGSAVVAFGGIAAGWRLYSRFGPKDETELDPIEKWKPEWFATLRGKFYIDELYELSVVRFNAWCATAARWMDEKVWEAAVLVASYVVIAFSWVNRLFDEFVVNLGFDRGCGGVRNSARWLSYWQNGQVQRYLRVIGLALVAFALIFIWGGGRR